MSETTTAQTEHTEATESATVAADEPDIEGLAPEPGAPDQPPVIPVNENGPVPLQGVSADDDGQRPWHGAVNPMEALYQHFRAEIAALKAKLSG